MFLSKTLLNAGTLRYCPSVKSFRNLEEYIEAALATARFEKIEGGKKVYAEIPAFRGAWADGGTQRQAVAELREVLKGWIDLQLERGQMLPAVKGVKPPELSMA
jgi:predicted RNase H-like HicB family nuclease